MPLPNKLIGLTLLLALVQQVHGQGNAGPGIDHSYKPLTMKLDDKGQKYIRFIMWHQMWLTQTRNNPGTLDINGNPAARSLDFGIRRSRVLMQSQISPRFLILTHFGINNQSFAGGGSTAGNNYLGVNTTPSNAGKKPQLFMHDIWTEYAVAPQKLHIGAGLHYWNGVSRLSSHSTLNFMTLDAPIFNWYNIEATDQFARQMGIYAKGQLGRWDYRLHLNKPFAFGTPQAAVASPRATNVLNENWATGGYINYMFGDKENNVLPFFVGSYLGTKKVFNIGAGWYEHKDATGSKDPVTGNLRLHRQRNFGVDVFWDQPINKKKGTAISVYSVWYNYDFGPGYLRNIGILNTHPTARPMNQDPKTSWTGGGNAQPVIGTGDIWYTQAGYLLPKLKNGTAFMPYAAFTYKNFDRIGKASGQYDLGVNYLLNGHNAKITLQYSTRPIYQTDGEKNPIRSGSRGQAIVQTHIFL